MLRILRMICDIGVVASLFWILAAMGVIFAQSSDVVVPPMLLQPLQQSLYPFAHMLRQHWPVSSVPFYGHTLDNTYLILVVVFAVLFVACLTLSSVLYQLDEQIKTVFRKLSHRWFVWQTQRKQNQYALKQASAIKSAVTSSILALAFENLSAYPQHQTFMNSLKQPPSNGSTVFDEMDRVLLQFDTVEQALRHAIGIAKRYRQQTEALPQQPEKPLGYRMALHVLTADNDLLAEDGFIWGLNRCVPLNHVYLSQQAAERAPDAPVLHTIYPGLTLTLVGSFSQLGERTFPQVYRLDTIQDDSRPH